MININRHELREHLVELNLLPLVIVSFVLFRSAAAQTPTRAPPSSELLRNSNGESDAFSAVGQFRGD